MAGLYEKATLAAALAAGNTPEWVEQATYLGMPTSDSDGVPLQNAVRADFSIKLRRLVRGRGATITFAVLDDDTTYTLTIDGIDQDFQPDTGSTLAEACTDLADVINQGSFDDVVIATATATTVEILGLGSEDYSIEFSAAGGTGEFAIEADASSAYAAFLAQEAGTGDVPGDWAAIQYGTQIPVSFAGMTNQLAELGGKSRLYVALFNLAGDDDDSEDVTLRASVAIGPSVVL